MLQLDPHTVWLIRQHRLYCLPSARMLFVTNVTDESVIRKFTYARTFLSMRDWKQKAQCFLYEEDTRWSRCMSETQNVFIVFPPRTFHVFNFIVAYLSLLHFAAWIVGRPHSGCRGHKGDNGSPLGLQWWKRHTAVGVLPRLQHWFYTVVLFHTGWINGKETKGQVPPFFYPFLRTFRRLFKSTKQCEGKWPLTSPFLVLYLSF